MERLRGGERNWRELEWNDRKTMNDTNMEYDVPVLTSCCCNNLREDQALALVNRRERRTMAKPRGGELTPLASRMDG